MRIGIDARFYGSVGKGLGRYTEKLLEYLETLDTENEYVVFLRRENFYEYRPKSPRFKKVLADFAWYGFAEQLLFPWLLYRFRFDLVHFPHFNVPLLYRKKFVVTIHDLILIHYPTLRNTTRPAWLYRLKFAAYRFVIAEAIRHAVEVIVVSRFTESDVLTHYPAAKGKITVTYEAAGQVCAFTPQKEENSFLSRFGLIPRQVQASSAAPSRAIIEPYLLYVGNAYPHKNLSLLIRAAKRFPGYRFLLVGKEDYFYTRLKAEAEREKAANVIFTGFLTDQELGILYRYATLYLFPSLYEGFGLPPLEAMMYGVPVLTSRAGSLPEVLGDAAMYFDPKREGALEEAIDILITDITDETRKHEIRKRGYRQAAKFNWHTMAEETRTLYQRAHQKNTEKH